jgi:hypothetical protein
MLLRISLILAILLGAGTIFITQKMARDHFTEMRDARDKNAKDRDIATQRYQKDEKTLAATSNVLNQTKQTLAKTEEELNGTKQQLASAQDTLNKTKSELAKTIETRKQVEADLAKWSELGVKPDQVRDMIAALQRNKDAIVALEDEKKILSRNVEVLQNRINILLGQDYEVPLPAGTKGSVVAVDPKWNFVVIDRGATNGMLEGGVLMVHRNSQLVGKIRIREVLQNRSVASPMPGWNLGEIEEGDQVIY